MKKINSILFVCFIFLGYILEAKPNHKPSWGKVNYTTLSHLDVVFDQFDLVHEKNFFKNQDRLSIPPFVTHVYLQLNGDFKFVEFPESVKYINKDIFKDCKIKAIILKEKTVAALLQKDYGKDNEKNIRKYFSLKKNCEIIIKESIHMRPNFKNNMKEPPFWMKFEKKFLDKKPLPEEKSFKPSEKDKKLKEKAWCKKHECDKKKALELKDKKHKKAEHKHLISHKRKEKHDVDPDDLQAFEYWDD